MKILKFLLFIQKNLMYRPEIDFKTVKQIIQYFKDCLSEKEIERYILALQTIEKITTQQISLTDIVLFLYLFTLY